MYQVFFGMTGVASLDDGSTSALTLGVAITVMVAFGAGVLAVINSLSRAQFLQKLREGDLRFVHSRAVSHVEP